MEILATEVATVRIRAFPRSDFLTKESSECTTTLDVRSATLWANSRIEHLQLSYFKPDSFLTAP